MRHIDIVSNEWDDQVQRRIATVTADGATGERADIPNAELPYCPPDIDPLDFLAATMQGSYVFATVVHDNDTCPFEFAASEELPMIWEPDP